MSAWRWMKENPVVSKPEVILPNTTLQVQRRLSDEDQRRVIAAYRSGKTVYEVGAQFGVHRTTVSAIMRRHGVRLRRQPKRPYRRSVPD